MKEENNVVAQEWNEQDTQDFLKYGKFFVPNREHQFQTIKTVIDSIPDGNYIVDICCGEGHLCEYLLENFEHVKILAIDGDEQMLKMAAKRLERFEGRFETLVFDIFKKDWRNFEQPISCFVSSLAIHHLNCEEKEELFLDLYNQLEPNGKLVIADLIKPQTDAGKEVCAIQWDRAVIERSLIFNGNLEGFEAFNRLGWNSYRDPNFENDPVDKPSTLGDQLKWMTQAGFINVDVHWMLAGHAIFSGIKSSNNE